MIFPRNKAPDLNKFENCEEYEHPNRTVAAMSLIRLVLYLELLHVKTSINADVSRSEKLKVEYE